MRTQPSFLLGPRQCVHGNLEPLAIGMGLKSGVDPLAFSPDPGKHPSKHGMGRLVRAHWQCVGEFLARYLKQNAAMFAPSSEPERGSFFNEFIIKTERHGVLSIISGASLRRFWLIRNLLEFTAFGVFCLTILAIFQVMQ